VNALVFDSSLQFMADYPDPKPERGEVLIAVKLAGICTTDLEILKGYMDFKGVLGHEFVGEVIKGSRKWLGKRVVAQINCVCGQCDMCQRGLANHCRRRTVLGISGRDGCFADMIAVPEHNLYEVPDGISDEQAVFVEPLAAAYQVIMQRKVESRMQVAVVGSGKMGLLMAQVLRNTGCKLEVIGRNEFTLGFCEKKGIQTRKVSELIPRADRDLVVECTGSPEGFELATQMVRPRGTLVLKSTYAKTAAINMTPIAVNEIEVVGSRCGPFNEAISALVNGQIDVESMIARQLPLSKGVEAMEMADDPNNIKIMLKVGS